MGTPLYNTDIIPLTSRPTLTVMDDGDYFVILDTSTGKISKILRTDVQKALSISYDNSASGLTAESVQAALDELVVNLGSSDSAISALGGRLDILEADELTEGSIAYDIKQSSNAIKGVGYTEGTLKTHEDRLDTLEGADTVVGSVAKTVKDAVADLAGTGRTTETVKGNADAIALRELSANKVVAFQETPDDTHYPSEKLVDDSLEAIKGVGYTDGTLKSHEDRLDTLEGADTVAGSVAKTVKDAVEPIIEDVSDHESRIGATEKSLLTTKLAVNELERQAQIGNGTTLDFSGIGSVALDARATGRANPTVEGLTAANMSKESKSFIGTIYRTYRSWYQLTQGHKYYISIARNLVSGTDNNASGRLRFNDGSAGSGLNDFWVFDALFGSWERGMVFNHSLPSGSYQLSMYGAQNPSTGTECVWSNFIFLDLTSTFGEGKEPNASDCAKIFSYFDGTKSIQLPARIISKSEDESETNTLYIADNEEVRSIQDVQDTLTMVNGEYIYTKKVSTPASVASGVAVNVTNYPTAKTGGKFAVELTAGGTQIGVIGTDSTSGAGTLRFELNTPVITPLTTSGILQAKQNGTVYYEPYYEGSHQTDASSQITLPYEGTIEAVYGYDEDLVEYLLDSSEYSLTGTTLTITDALENEVFFVQMSRSEPLAPEMSVNVINNDQVTLDSADGKYYQIGFTTTNGVPTVTATEVV